jgi:hypothetical protein
MFGAAAPRADEDAAAAEARMQAYWDELRLAEELAERRRWRQACAKAVIPVFTALLIAVVVFCTESPYFRTDENPVTQIELPAPAPALATTEFNASDYNASVYRECPAIAPNSLREPTTLANEDKAASFIDAGPASESWPAPCRLDHIRFCTNITFEAHCDDSRSNTTIKYLRLHTKEVQTFSFQDFGLVSAPQRAALRAGVTTVSFDGVALTCRSSVPAILLKDGSMSNPCFPLDHGTVSVILVEARFEPRVGQAKGNNWSRNSYSISGSYYEAYCNQRPNPDGPAAPSLECGWPCAVLFWVSVANFGFTIVCGVVSIACVVDIDGFEVREFVHSMECVAFIVVVIVCLLMCFWPLAISDNYLVTCPWPMAYMIIPLCKSLGWAFPAFFLLVLVSIADDDEFSAEDFIVGCGFCGCCGFLVLNVGLLVYLRVWHLDDDAVTEEQHLHYACTWPCTALRWMRVAPARR